jgi:hypothetical protein
MSMGQLCLFIFAADVHPLGHAWQLGGKPT